MQAKYFWLNLLPFKNGPLAARVALFEEFTPLK
jgi:hypothetical protein